ncbi:MAG: DUF2059 domain-containing protein [Sphaerospermopsis sp. SIO1G2]|nr:DUF2059 domain-containing protein [Sphaerospermopsis sp. SIO1G2]
MNTDLQTRHLWKLPVMKIKFLISATLISLTASINLPAFAQTASETPIKQQLIANANKTEKINNIKKLLEITNEKAMTQQMMNQMFSTMKSQYPNLPASFWNAFMAEIDIDKMVNESIPLYDKYFTNEEIKGMIAFYQTPLGKKTLNVLPQITTEFMNIGVKYGREAAQRAIEKLKSQGEIP